MNRLVLLLSFLLMLSCADVTNRVEPPTSHVTGGLAAYKFYTCKTATKLENENLTYKVNNFNNTRSAIDLYATVPKHVKDWYDADPTVKRPRIPARLVKIGTDTWSSKDKRYTVRLKNKSNGKKSIEVVDHTIKKTASRENGFCTFTCAIPTVLHPKEKRCVWSGIAPDDEVGNMLISVVASSPLGITYAIKNATGRLIKNIFIGNIRKHAKSGFLLGRGVQPVPGFIKQTFLNQKYKVVKVTKPVKLTRVYGGTANRQGFYFTDFIPASKQEARRKLALLPEWGNSVRHVDVVEVSRDIFLNVGKAAPQQHLAGGGTQATIAIPKGWAGTADDYLAHLYASGKIKIVQHLRLR